MKIRPFAPFDVQSLSSVDEALDKLLSNIDELQEMTDGPLVLGPKEQWALDSNLQACRQTCERVETLIRSEKQP